MLRILDLNKNPIIALTRYEECCVTSSLDFSDKTLKFKAYIDDINGLVNEGYVLTKKDRYVIKEVNPSSEGEVEIVGQLDLESLEGKAWPTFVAKEQTIDVILSLAFVKTGWTVNQCTVTKKRSMSMTNCSSLDILTEALKVFRCEVVIDSLNQKVSIFEEIGEDKGVYFIDDLNLKKLDVSSTSYDFYTEIEPYGKIDTSDTDTDTPKLSSLTIGSYEFTPSTTVLTGDSTTRHPYEITPSAITTINSSDRISAYAGSDNGVITIYSNGLEFENGDSVDWDEGSNTLVVEVKLNEVTAVYTITVTSDPSQLALSSMSIGSLTLEPEFDPNVTSYKTYTRNSRNRIKASINSTYTTSSSSSTKQEATLTITANGTTVESGEHATWVDGANNVNIELSSDGSTKTYYVQVNKVDAVPETEEEEEDLTLTIAEISADDVVHDTASNRHYITNYSYSDKQKRYIWKDDDYSDAESLAEDARAKLEDMAKPYVSYTAEVKDLANASQTYDILAYSLGDTITLIDTRTGTREKQRIVETTEYEYDPESNSCTLANKVLTFDEIQQKWQTTADTVDNITSNNGTVDGSKVSNVNASSINGLAASINNLYVSGKLTAVEAEIGTLYANVGNFETLTATKFTAQDAEIENLRVTYLEGDTAKLNVLWADTANIKNLLAGTATVGDLQTITLTSHNTTIMNDFVETLLAQNAIISTLVAGEIDTSEVAISSADGRISISDATIQFKDKNENLRLQIGEDANGDFTFILYGEAGTGVLIDSTGIKESAIGDGLIKNDHVAENAGILASKLDIDSLFTVINESGKTIYSNRIWFDDEKQSLNQLYVNMSSSITVANENSSTAVTTANNASQVASKALEALSGISTMDAISVLLSNDAHVVHTETDGTGGNYSDCMTTIDVYLGDAIISDQASFIVDPSSGVSGTWNQKTRTYSVSGMTTDNGYVDFTATYNSTENALQTVSGQTIKTVSGDELMILGGGTTISKRFSISKAPDGQIGLSYNLTSSVLAITVDEKTGTLAPKTVTFTTTINSNNVVKTYSGYYLIEESSDGSSWTSLYSSSSAENYVSYTPRTWLTYKERYIRATIRDASYTTLDQQTVLILVSAEGLAGQIDDLSGNLQQFVTETYTTQVGDFEDSIDTVKRSLLQTTTELSGVSDTILLWQPMYSYTSTEVTVTARLYKSGLEVTKDYPSNWYTWILKTEDGEEFLGTGYTLTFDRDRVGFGGVVIAQFASYKNVILTTKSGANIKTRSGKDVELYTIDLSKGEE